MKKTNKLVIVGDSAFAQIAYEYFTHDSEYEVVAFSVEKPFLRSKQLCDLPVVPFENLEIAFPPDEHRVFVAVTYIDMNRVRTRLYRDAKAKGFQPVTYVSSRAFVWRNAQIGENCFIFENNIVQPFVTIGNNVILWSGNHIGHHSRISNNVFISSHVVISGFVEIGENCFFGVNSTISNNVRIAQDCLIGAGALVTKNTRKGEVYKGATSHPTKARSLSYFRIQSKE